MGWIIYLFPSTVGDLFGFLPMRHNEAKSQYSLDCDEYDPQIPLMQII